MPSLNVPSPEEVQKDLELILPTIHTALEHGTLKAREFFEREDQDNQIDRYLAPNLVRYWAKRYLRNAGLQVSEEQAEFNMQQLPNNGLCLSFGHYRLRILKSDDGDPPVPGDSVSRQNFYHQISIAYVTEDGAEVQENVTNLLILWDIDRLYNLTGLSLAYPKSGKDTKASVQVHWHVPITHPAFAFTVDAESQPVNEEDNLPLKLKQIEKKTEEAG
jgi:hypothetical protein